MAENQGMTPEFAATYREILLGGLTNEAKVTSKILAAIPDDKRDYRPDPHARTAWELGWHMANTDVQFLDGIAEGNFAMNNPDEASKPKNVTELVTWYDENMARGFDRLRQLTPEQLTQPVNFMGIFNFPAVMYLGFLNNHSIHHRGQLATYLRPMGSKCPSIYGGSYDEPFQGAPAENAA
ncbi:MAG TPA: DinB family protein [Edaphobacter sp.]|nr:DinB family protein [Edaphobacter sp.]